MPRTDNPEVRAVQRRTVTTLVGAQILVGVGVSAGAAVGALLAEQASGSAEFAGLGGTFQVLGGALIAIPMAHLMAAYGRRWGLLAGYGFGLVGALIIIVAGTIGNFALLLLGATLFGGANAANSQARFAAADLADEARRGRDLSVVVWATTVGAVLGPNLAGPGAPVARALGVPELAGPYVFSLVGLALGALLLAFRLRPDPLLLARRVEAAQAQEPLQRQRGSIVGGVRTLLAHRDALLGVVAVSVGHTVMVSVMVMTPLHMHHGGASLRVVGLVISVHILGMFAFSPLVGLAVDKWGGRGVVVTGALVQVASGLLAAQAPAGWSSGLALGLFLLGLGWSGTLIGGSALVVEAVPLRERTGTQGATDLAMGLAAGAGGALAGVVVARLGYPVLGALGAGLAGVVVVAAVALRAGAKRGLSGD
ncbi:MAG TPA: MFS transporter [Propionibacteriaceae bacterium]|nr:MFS transporter [Propionibacteriaceae bacterium]